MIVPQKRLVIVGATGMVGGEALRYALDHAAVGAATAIGRKPTGLAHPKLKEVLHQDFADCSALAGALSGQDAAVFCLGAYTGAVPDAELRRITVDYTVEFARVLRASSPNATFAFLPETKSAMRTSTSLGLPSFSDHPSVHRRRVPGARDRAAHRIPRDRVGTSWPAGQRAVEAELSASLRSKSTIFLLRHTDAGGYPIVH